MTIRDYEKKDEKEYFLMSHDFYGGAATLHTIPDEHLFRTLKEIEEKPEFARLLMLEENGKIAGYLLLSFMWSNESGGEAVWVEELYLKEEYRGRGFGTQALKWIFSEYRNAARYRLEVTLQNGDAMRLYEKMGFETLEYIQMIQDTEK